MNVVEFLFLKDYGPFKNLKLKIEPGLTAVYGLNKSTGKNSRNSNGVGKSAAFHSLSEIIYEDPIVGEKQDRVRTGSRGFQFVTARGGKRILVERKAKGAKAESVEIKVDGQNKNFRTSKIAKTFLKKAWPISLEEYQTYIHIDSLVPHPLVRGNSAQRKAFFTSFFGLDKIDAERKLYVAELAKLKRTRAAFDELRVQYDRLKQQLVSPTYLKKYKRRVSKLKKELRTVQQEFESVQETLRLIQFAEASFEQIKKLKEICHGEVTEEAFAKAKKDNKWEVQAFEEKLEHAQRWEQYQQDLIQYEESLAKLSPKSRILLDKYGLTRLRDLASERYQKRLEISTQLSSLARTMGQLKDTIRNKLPPEVEAPSEDAGDLETLRRAYKHQLDHAQKFKQGKCETCGQIVKIKDPGVLRNKLESVVKKLNKHAQAVKYREALKEQQAARAEWKKLKLEYDTLSEEEVGLLKWETVHKEVRDLLSQPAPYKGKRLTVKIQKRCLEEVKEIRSLLQYMGPHLQTVIDFLSLSKDEVKQARASEGLNERMASIQDRLSQYLAKIELHRTIAEQVKDMKARLLEMKAQLKDEPALKYLVQGYQDKNIKKMAIEAISQHLMALVNRYAQRIMPERFTFEFKWDTQIHILVHRHYGQKVKTSDVRKLSGAESTLFTLILVCALLAFVPSYKRCNLMILDEPTARFSPAMTDVFKNLLQILNQIVPSIVVITPKSDERYADAKPYTVVKQNGESTIVQGYPDEVKDQTKSVTE